MDGLKKSAQRVRMMSSLQVMMTARPTDGAVADACVRAVVATGWVVSGTVGVMWNQYRARVGIFT